MATLDLKPLTKETIHKLGFNNHDLWLVKIHMEVFGPFESQSLKEYASQNETLFDEALAGRMDTGEFQPFWSFAVFGRRSPQVLKQESHQGPFWLLLLGQKQGPYSFHDIDKKIEMGLVALTEHISTDDGNTWKKVYEIEEFDRRTHSANELPEAPFDSSFQKAKLSLMERMDRPHVSTQDELANMAHHSHVQGKVLTLKLDELTLQNLKNTEVSSAFRWALPGAAVFIFTLVTTGYFILTPGEIPMTAEEPLPEKTREVASLPNPSKQLPPARAEVPRPSMPERRPASVRPYTQETNAFNQDSRYPTEMETHSDYPAEEPERLPVDDPMSDMVMDAPEKEHSLVSQPQQQDDHSLDAAMNGVVQPVEPVIEEASDF